MTPTDPAIADGLITFPGGVPGFEQFRRFVLVASEDVAPFKYLQGLDAAAPSFVAIDPRVALPGYQHAVSAADRARLGATSDEEGSLLWLALVTVGEHAATANLRAPIVINPDTMLGVQIVPAESPYALTHPLAEF